MSAPIQAIRGPWVDPGFAFQLAPVRTYLSVGCCASIVMQPGDPSTDVSGGQSLAGIQALGAKGADAEMGPGRRVGSALLPHRFGSLGRDLE